MAANWSPHPHPPPRSGRLTQAERLGKVPPISITGRRSTVSLPMAGLDPDHPVVCGDETPGMAAVQIRATGLRHNVRAGQVRWVVGSGVADALADGTFAWMGVAPAPVVRPTNLPDGTPGSEPGLLATIDRWQGAFTPCTGCGDPAPPGTEVCPACAEAAAADPHETPLQRALRLAGT